MLILLLCLGILSILIGWLLFAPFVLQIDTRYNVYTLRWGSMVRAAFVPLPNDWRICVNIPFYRREFSLIQLLSQKRGNQMPIEKTAQLTKKPRVRWRWSYRRFIRVLRTFRVPYCMLEVDTDDFVTNAYLYPLCRALSAQNHAISINFQGRKQCVLRVQNRLANVLAAFIF